jgi:hypothetical protein
MTKANIILRDIQNTIYMAEVEVIPAIGIFPAVVRVTHWMFDKRFTLESSVQALNLIQEMIEAANRGTIKP